MKFYVKPINDLSIISKYVHSTVPNKYLAVIMEFIILSFNVKQNISVFSYLNLYNTELLTSEADWFSLNLLREIWFT